MKLLVAFLVFLAPMGFASVQDQKPTLSKRDPFYIKSLSRMRQTFGYKGKSAPPPEDADFIVVVDERLEPKLVEAESAHDENKMEIEVRVAPLPPPPPPPPLPWYLRLQETWPGNPHGHKLGAGTYGSVYLVRDPKYDTLYAKKRIHIRDFNKNEVETHMVLSKNPNIVQLFHYYQEGNFVYLIMEYCPGGTLQNAISRSRYLSEREARYYLAQLICAFQDLQVRRIAYRDLKANNVLLDAEGIVKLADFGLAKAMPLGSPGVFESRPHIAPELFKGPSHSPSCDLWSLGLLFYQMLVGEYPSSRSEVLEFPPQVSRQAADLLEKLLRAKPETRLGARRFQELKDHVFFQGIDWKRIPTMRLRDMP